MFKYILCNEYIACLLFTSEYIIMYICNIYLFFPFILGEEPIEETCRNTLIQSNYEIK